MISWIYLLSAFTSAWVFESGVEYFSLDVKLKWSFNRAGDEVTFEL